MKSFSSFVCCLVLALSATGCWVPELPDDAVFSCDRNEDCAADGVVCAPRANQRGYCCTPTAEVCNGADDNCNGQMDDLPEASCYSGPEGTLDKGRCAAGKLGCGSNGSMVCLGEVLPATAESCNGVDDDCDGELDEGINLQTDNANCGGCGNVCNAVTELCIDGACKKREETVCGDGLDNDQDSATDCSDSDCEEQARTCSSSQTAQHCICYQGELGEGACGDNLDNDADGFTDCTELECAGKSCGPGCVCTNFVKKETVCTDGLDNDGTEGTDCADPDCANESCGTGCVCKSGKAAETVCTDGLDNDGTEGTDCADPDCANESCSLAGGCLCTGGTAKETLCGDGLDNDGKGDVDCADPDCAWTDFGDGTLCAGGSRVEVACSDSKDNDGNGGKLDCASGNSDPNCVSGLCGVGCSFNNCVKRETICNDRIDNDGNNGTDCSDQQDCPQGVACTRNNGQAGTCQSNRTCG